MTPLEVVVAVAILLGLVGIVVPLLPGVLLVGAAILVWAIDTGGRTAWVVLGVALAVILIGAVLKYVLPGRRLQDSGVPTVTIWTGAGLGVIGFFVIPVVGLFLGFVLGVYLAERARVGDAARTSTTAALRAVGLSILIELTSGVLAAAAWVVGVTAT
ncbi:DUF456 domain-containing protein [Nocardioides euryhalodurans]|uniref:DUF456 domain-containing protein n=1 Tax=Nocardioides euryhalodurans TaxID=2518370 RepID=A0A4P7GGQ7_9ACTN|nr:DUF456 domain-containing protein [Nocardioides euryhalodurans]QBR90923.1 DUF456 domain-containing protein [Nocardioides euryhalodurans]